MAGLVQVAAMEPQPVLLGRFPHVALFTHPRTRVLGCIGPKAPALAHLVGHILADQIRRPAVHRPIARGIDDHIGRQMRAILQHHTIRHQLGHIAMGELDLAVDDQLAGAHVDVIARSAPQVLHEQARSIGPPIQPEPSLFQPRVEICIHLLDLVIDRDLEFMQDLVRQRGKDQVCFFRRHTRPDRLFGIKRAKPVFHQRFRPHDMSR